MKTLSIEHDVTPFTLAMMAKLEAEGREDPEVFRDSRAAFTAQMKPVAASLIHEFGMVHIAHLMTEIVHQLAEEQVTLSGNDKCAASRMLLSELIVNASTAVKALVAFTDTHVAVTSHHAHHTSEH